MNFNIRWATLDNESGTNTLKQHAFQSKGYYKPYTREFYEGNKSLCGKFNCSEDGEYSDSIDKVPNEDLDEATACKTCLRVATSEAR